jgi:hypothetical protein
VKEYRICIRGNAEPLLREVVDDGGEDVAVTTIRTNTVVTGLYTSQESLWRFLGQLRDLGLEVTSTEELGSSIGGDAGDPGPDQPATGAEHPNGQAIDTFPSGGGGR